MLISCNDSSPRGGCSHPRSCTSAEGPTSEHTTSRRGSPRMGEGAGIQRHAVHTPTQSASSLSPLLGQCPSHPFCLWRLEVSPRLPGKAEGRWLLGLSKQKFDVSSEALSLSDPQPSREEGRRTLIFFYWGSHTPPLASVPPLNALTELMLLKGMNSAGIWQFTRSSGV